MCPNKKTWRKWNSWKPADTRKFPAGILWLRLSRGTDAVAVAFSISEFMVSYLGAPYGFFFHKRKKATIFDSLFHYGDGGIWTLAPLITAYSLSRGAPSATWVLPQVGQAGMKERKWRREWDSNPRYLSVSLVFKTSSLNHSDTSPDGWIFCTMCSYLIPYEWYFDSIYRHHQS